MRRLPFPGIPTLRYVFAVLIALAPFGAPSAAVSVAGDMGGNIGPVSCPSASSISYDLDQSVFSFYCGATSLTYSCTTTSVDYGTGTQAITMACENNSGSALGLVVNAMVDGVQNGNGNNDGFCNNAENFTFTAGKGKYSWTCNNGGGNNKNVACWTSGANSNFDLAVNQFNMDCVTIFSRSGFEDFEELPEIPLQ